MNTAKTKSGRWKQANRERAREYDRRYNAKRGSSRWYKPCPLCGELMRWGNDVTRCLACRREDEEERRQQLLDWRRAGLMNREIADQLGMTPHSVTQRFSDLRKEGYEVPVSPYRMRGKVT